MLAARLGAARLSLCNRSRDPLILKQISSVQARAVLSQLVRVLPNASEEVIASITDMVTQCEWQSDDLALLLDAVHSRSNVKKTKRKKCVLQSFEPEIADGFTKTDWEMFLSDNAPTDKQQTIYRRVYELTGRNLCEPTFKFLTALWLITSQGFTRAFNMPQTMKDSMLTHFKKGFRNFVRYLPKIEPKIDSLPPRSVLQQLHPVLYDSCYGDDSPVDCGMPREHITSVDSGMKCRPGGKALLAIQDRTQSMALDITPQGNMVNSIVGAFCSAMQQMRQSPGIDLNEMSSGNLASPNFLRKPKALANLADRPAYNHRRALTLHDLEDEEQMVLAGRPSYTFRNDFETEGEAKKQKVAHQEDDVEAKRQKLVHQADAKDFRVGDACASGVAEKSDKDIEDVAVASDESSANTVASGEPSAIKSASDMLDDSLRAMSDRAREQREKSKLEKVEKDKAVKDKNVKEAEAKDEKVKAVKDTKISEAKEEEEEEAKETVQTETGKDDSKEEVSTPIVKRRNAAADATSMKNDKSALVPKPSGKAKAVADAKAAADATPPKEANPASVRSKKKRCCGLEHEKSRSQFLGRTGLKGPGQSVQFKYGPCHKYKSIEDAKVAGVEWLRGLK